MTPIVLLPFTMTLAPIIGSPFASFTIPLTVLRCWGTAVIASPFSTVSCEETAQALPLKSIINDVLTSTLLEDKGSKCNLLFLIIL